MLTSKLSVQMPVALEYQRLSFTAEALLHSGARAPPTTRHAAFAACSATVPAAACICTIMYTIFCCVPASAVHLHSILHTLQHMCVPAAVMLLPLSLCACCASVADHASTAWGLASIAAVLLLSCTCLLSTAAVPPYAAMQKGDSLRRDRAPKHRQAKALEVEHQPVQSLRRWHGAAATLLPAESRQHMLSECHAYHIMPSFQCTQSDKVNFLASGLCKAGECGPPPLHTKQQCTRPRSCTSLVSKSKLLGNNKRKTGIACMTLCMPYAVGLFPVP